MEIGFVAGFDYDVWANSRWLDAVPLFPAPQRPIEILDHVAWAQATWLRRVGGDIEQVERASEEAFAQMSQMWREIVAERETDELIMYQNLAGVPFTQPLGAIAWHVINHGTYHRGQLRGLAEGQGVEGYPETDLIRYFIER